MGLDMYLDKEIYVGGEYEHRKVDGIVEFSVYGKEKIKIPIEKVSSIILRAGYWRKANQIHNWFVENVQDGEDDCGRYYVSEKKLIELMDLCEQVLEDKELAPDLLPVKSGFFFGRYKYDEWYFKDLEYTIEIIRDCIGGGYGGEYYYSSSW